MTAQIIPFPKRPAQRQPDEFDSRYPDDPKEAQRWREFHQVAQACVDECSRSVRD